MEISKKLKTRMDDWLAAHDAMAPDDKAAWVIRSYSGSCAAVATQPLPFADIAVLTPVQVVMGQHLARVRGIRLSRERIGEIVGEISVVVGMGLLAQQLVMGMYKLGLPFAGGLMTIPLVFGFTWAMGKVLDHYFMLMSAGEPVDSDQLKSLFKKELKRGRDLGKAWKKHRNT